MKNNLKRKNMKKRLISPLFFIALPIYLAVSAILELAKRSVTLADKINGGIAQTVRRFMATLTAPADFSIFECIVISLFIIVPIIIAVAVNRFKRREGRLRLISWLLAVIMLLLSGNTICLGFGYRTTPLRENLSLEYVEITEDRLAESLIYVRDQLNLLSLSIEYKEDGTSIGYDLDEVSEKLCLAFEDVSEEYKFFDNFESRVKPVKNGAAMTYLGISGIYTYYTGESNVNTAFPIAEMTYVAAHELSHQRGIMRENEANFMAYLVTTSSDDLYLNYAGYLSMYQYLASALYRTNKDRYYEINLSLSSGPRGDIAEINRVILAYGDTFIADISSFVNDVFLKSSGTAGVVTYGEVVKLTVAYYHDLGIIS